MENEDLEMDSMDITELLFDVCSIVGIDRNTFGIGRKLETLRDLIYLVLNEYRKW